MSPAVVAALFAAHLAASPTPSPAGPRVAEGRWGGVGIALDVTVSGARIELDCAHGTIDAPLALDAQGAFDLPGTLVRERPGPVREGQTETIEPVRYTGRLEGDALTLRIVRPNAPKASTPLSAVFGQTPRLRKCG